MLRFVSFLMVTLTALATGLIGIGMLLGQTMPADAQFAYAFARRDQWTRVALIDPQSGMMVNRFLPMVVEGMQWSRDGQRMVVTGSRNQKSRLYMLDYRPALPAKQWVANSEDPSSYALKLAYSPDMRWIALPVRSEDGTSIAMMVERIDSDTPREVSQSLQPIISDRSYWTVRGITWTADSRYFVYARVRMDAVPDTYYYVIDTTTQEHRQIHPTSTFEVQLSPGGRYLLYSAVIQPVLPAQDLTEYIPRFGYYLYEIATGESQLLTDVMPYQLRWSPDDSKILVSSYVEPQDIVSLQMSPDPVEHLLKNPIPWYAFYNGAQFYLTGTSNRYALSDTNMNFTTMYGNSRGMNLQFYQMSYGRGMENLPFTTAVYDLTERRWHRIDPARLPENYTVNWLPSGKGLVISPIVTQELNGMLTTMVTQSHLYWLEDVQRAAQRTGQLEALSFEEIPLVISQIAPNTDSLLLTPELTWSGGQGNNVYLADANTGRIIPIDLNDDPFVFASWSSDDRWLVVNASIPIPASAFSTFIQPQPSMVPLMQYPTPTPFSGLAQFSTVTPSAASIISITGMVQQSAPPPMNRMYLVNVQTGKAEVLTDTYEMNVMYWSPDGNAALYFDTLGYQSGSPAFNTRTLYYLDDLQRPDVSPERVAAVNSRNMRSAILYPLWRPTGDPAQ